MKSTVFISLLVGLVALSLLVVKGLNRTCDSASCGCRKAQTNNTQSGPAGKSLRPVDAPAQPGNASPAPKVPAPARTAGGTLSPAANANGASAVVEDEDSDEDQFGGGTPGDAASVDDEDDELALPGRASSARGAVSPATGVPANGPTAEASGPALVPTASVAAASDEPRDLAGTVPLAEEKTLAAVGAASEGEDAQLLHLAEKVGEDSTEAREALAAYLAREARAKEGSLVAGRSLASSGAHGDVRSAVGSMLMTDSERKQLDRATEVDVDGLDVSAEEARKSEDIRRALERAAQRNPENATKYMMAASKFVGDSSLDEIEEANACLRGARQGRNDQYDSVEELQAQVDAQMAAENDEDDAGEEGTIAARLRRRRRPASRDVVSGASLQASEDLTDAFATGAIPSTESFAQMHATRAG